MNKTVLNWIVAGVVVVSAVIAGGAWWLVKEKNNQPIAPPVAQSPVPAVATDKACTEEAKICADGSAVARTGPNCEFAECPLANNAVDNATGKSEIANPSSVSCEKDGGASLIRTGADGGQVGFCIFPDGSECEEWKYFRGECKLGDSLADIDMSDWQMYRNEKYGFQFKYPKDWKIEIIADNVAENCDGGKTACNRLIPSKQQACVKLDNDTQSCLDSISFGVINNEKNLAFKDFIKQEYGWSEESGVVKNNRISEMPFGDGRKYTFTEINGFDGASVSQFWVTLDDGNFVNISGSYLDGHAQKVYGQITVDFEILMQN